MSKPVFDLDEKAWMDQNEAAMEERMEKYLELAAELTDRNYRWTTVDFLYALKRAVIATHQMDTKHYPDEVQTHAFMGWLVNAVLHDIPEGDRQPVIDEILKSVTNYTKGDA